MRLCFILLQSNIWDIFETEINVKIQILGEKTVDGTRLRLCFILLQSNMWDLFETEINVKIQRLGEKLLMRLGRDCV